MFAGAPLVFRNQTGQWLCETQAGHKYGPLEGQRQ